jgi:AcrR family transcriptional regulator
VSPAAAYRHFADKSALLGAVAIDGMGRLAAGMEKALARVPGPAGSAAHAAASLAAAGGAYVEFALRHPAHFRVMFGPWCEHPAMDQLPPEALRGGRDPYQILVDVLDALVASGAVNAEARQGAEIAAWSMVHGLASLLVDGALELGARERAQATALLGRTLLLGLGCHPVVAGPAAAPVDGDPRHPPWKRRC